MAEDSVGMDAETFQNQVHTEYWEDRVSSQNRCLLAASVMIALKPENCWARPMPLDTESPVWGIPSECDEHCQQIRAIQLRSFNSSNEVQHVCRNARNSVSVVLTTNQHNWCSRLNGRGKRPHPDRSQDSYSSNGEGLLGFLR